jgi:hypothetical protein
MKITNYGHLLQFQQNGETVDVKVELPRHGRSPNSKYMRLQPHEAMRAGLALVEAGARAAAARASRTKPRRRAVSPR